MDALTTANEILLEMAVIVPETLVVAAGFTSLKEMVVNNASTRRVFVGAFVERCGSPDQALDLLAKWSK